MEATEEDDIEADAELEANLEFSVFDVLDTYVDKVVPEGAPMIVGEDLGNGIVRAQVEDSYLVPDFSSFDRI